ACRKPGCCRRSTGIAPAKDGSRGDPPSARRCHSDRGRRRRADGVARLLAAPPGARERTAPRPVSRSLEASADELPDGPRRGPASFVPLGHRLLPQGGRRARGGGTQPQGRHRLGAYRRLRDRKRRRHERRAWLVAGPEPQGELERRPGQRNHRSRPAPSNPPRRGERSAGARPGRPPFGRKRRSGHPRPQPHLCTAMVQLCRNRAAYLCSGGAEEMARGAAQAVSGEMHVLPNGLPDAESVSLGVYAMVGSRSEPEHLSGLAHVVEHMVFKGAGARDTRQIAESIEDVGGIINAWTARDQTVFYGRTLAKDAPLLAELIADFLRAPHLNEDHLEHEKAVILSELGEVVDSPDDLVHDHLFEAAFGAQPLGRSVLGCEETLSAITAQDCRAWIRDELVPSRLILSASGRIERDEVLR